jgi:hypothetical protein
MQESYTHTLSLSLFISFHFLSVENSAHPLKTSASTNN